MELARCDLIAICETWLKSEDKVIIGNIIPAGYSFKQVPRATQKRGGGIALLYKTGFNVRLTYIGLLPRSFEFLSAEFITPTVSLRLIILYRPQQKSTFCTFSEFLDEFTLLIDNVLLSPMPLIVGGDFNIHVNDSCDNSAKSFIDLLSSSGLLQHISGHTLDLLITRDVDPPVIGDISITSLVGKGRYRAPP